MSRIVVVLVLPECVLILFWYTSVKLISWIFFNLVLLSCVFLIFFISFIVVDLILAKSIAHGECLLLAQIYEFFK